MTRDEAPSPIPKNPNAGIRYVAFLRGINLGKRRVKMETLAAIFTDAGFAGVRTVIASGNVLFGSDQEDMPALATMIEAVLTDSLGYEVKTVVRTVADLQTLVARDPFAGIDPNEAKCDVVFLAQPPADLPALPAHFPDEHFAVLEVDGATVFMIRHRRPDGRGFGSDANSVDRLFGRGATVRTWNTVVKIAGL
ncbi:MAG TPA: DUF1697 domain-containing protein [Thermomicrobiales bacterium]|nr:DUF1697 domain-containing protein [Thermomicrobiales bacterium]